MRPKRSLGQNFLIDPNIRRKLVAELQADRRHTVLEVGPGHGELSELLVGRVGRLVLVEKDDALATELRERWGARGDVRLVHGDALEVDLDALVAGAAPVRVISNLPYSITSPLIFRLIRLRPRPQRMVLMVQREVAQRLAAEPGSREYGALSVGVRADAEVRIAFPVSRSVFRPVPRVDSAAVVVEPGPPLPPGRRRALRMLTRAAFSRRRKQLQKILRTAPVFALPGERAESLLRELGVDPRARPESLSPERFVDLAAALWEETGRARGAIEAGDDDPDRSPGTGGDGG